MVTFLFSKGFILVENGHSFGLKNGYIFGLLYFWSVKFLFILFELYFTRLSTF